MLSSRFTKLTLHSQNFGLVGNGRLHIMGLGSNGVSVEKMYASPSSSHQLCFADYWYSFDTQDALYDTAWSESNENQLVAASGDGTVKLYDITVNQFPVMQWQEHTREVYSVSWNLVSKDTFCSSSWDGTIKVVCVSHNLPNV
jgi:peroxin-7